MEARGDPSLCPGEGQYVKAEERASIAARSTEATRKTTRRGGRLCPNEIISVIMSVLCSPLEACFRCDVWLNDDRMLTLNNTGIIVTNCLNRCKLRINKLTVYELFHLQKDGKCHYECLSLNHITNMYYDITTSLEALFRLLIFQFHDIDTVRNFLITIYYFLDRHLDEGKKIQY